MILVNSPGNHSAYAWLKHSPWNGCTLADVVFPFFLFIVGVSLVFSLSKSVEQGIPFSQLFKKITIRALIIFLIGLFLNAFPYHFHFDSLRVYGVLQRIAICYFVAALLFLTTRVRTQAIFFVVFLLAYWIVMNMSHLTREENLAGYVDRFIFSYNHLYEKVFDPEGFLSTFPAIATTLLGNLTGVWLLSANKVRTKWHGLTIIGVAALIIGWVWGLFFPINKNLWSSSYVLWTGGLALLLLAMCYWLIDIKKWKKWSKPFEIFGLNAIAAYFLHIFFLKIQAMIHLPKMDGSMGNLRIYITEHLFGWTTLETASLLYAISYVFLWLLILSMLYRKKLFIKI